MSRVRVWDRRIVVRVHYGLESNVNAAARQKKNVTIIIITMIKKSYKLLYRLTVSLKHVCTEMAIDGSSRRV